MNNIVLPKIDFTDISIWKYWNPQKAFEYLCADFLWIYHDLDFSPVPSEIPNFPWVESWEFDVNWKKCWYQAKFGWDAFQSGKWFYKSFKTIKENIEKWIYNIEKLFLCSKEDLSPAKKQNFDKACESFSTETWIEIESFFWSKFLWILRGDNRFWNLIYEYFPTNDIKIKAYNDYSKEEAVNQDELNSIIGKVENGFSWQYQERDIKLAKHHQKHYSLKKLSYSTYPWILNTYEKLETDVAEWIFPSLEYGDTYKSLQNFLTACVDKLKAVKTISNQYKIELEHMIWDEYWLFINYWTQWYSCLEYEKPNKINFKDKRTNG